MGQILIHILISILKSCCLIQWLSPHLNQKTILNVSVAWQILLVGSPTRLIKNEFKHFDCCHPTMPIIPNRSGTFLFVSTSLNSQAIYTKKGSIKTMQQASWPGQSTKVKPLLPLRGSRVCNLRQLTQILHFIATQALPNVALAFVHCYRLVYFKLKAPGM